MQGPCVTRSHSSIFSWAGGWCSGTDKQSTVRRTSGDRTAHLCSKRSRWSNMEGHLGKHCSPAYHAVDTYDFVWSQRSSTTHRSTECTQTFFLLHNMRSDVELAEHVSILSAQFLILPFVPPEGSFCLAINDSDPLSQEALRMFAHFAGRRPSNAYLSHLPSFKPNCRATVPSTANSSRF